MPIDTALRSIGISLHLLSVVVWVGGMFFAYMALRPAAASLLEPPARLSLWVAVFRRFFPWVWAAIVIILATGLWIIAAFYVSMAKAPLHIHLMYGLGLVMMGLFFFVFFFPYRKLKTAVIAQDWPQGGRHLAVIRRVVGLNTALGLIVTVVGVSRLAF
jgi:uncharacterized membrane protein